MNLEFQYDKCRIIKKNVSGNIQSITPIYKSENDSVFVFNELANEMRKIADKFKGIKFVAEINSIPDADFQIIKEDLNFKKDFTDHGKKFYYNTNDNSVIIGHIEI